MDYQSFNLYSLFKNYMFFKNKMKDRYDKYEIELSGKLRNSTIKFHQRNINAICLIFLFR